MGARLLCLGRERGHCRFELSLPEPSEELLSPPLPHAASSKEMELLLLQLCPLLMHVEVEVVGGAARGGYWRRGEESVGKGGAQEAMGEIPVLCVQWPPGSSPNRSRGLMS